ncbi:MAG TPA: FAD-dependent oxidoreductase [Rhodanobacteraceae bacterium]
MTSGCDLIVVGGGIIGCACADAASAEGMRVLVLEPEVVGGGTTAASMGHLVAVDGEPAELALAAYSQQCWEPLHELPDIEYSRCGTLWIASDDTDLARVPGMQARLAAVGVQAQPVDATALYALEPSLTPGLAGGLLVPGEGVLYPPTAARRLLERACQRGATLRRARVGSIDDGSVVLADGERIAGQIVVATGGDLPHLLPALPIRLRRGHLVITERYPRHIHHQLVQLHYADSAHGEADSVAFNVQPRPTGQILIGSSREYGADTTAISLPMLRRMLHRAFEFLPGLRALNALRVWAGLRPATTDGLPYIGRMPGRRDVWVGAGHEGLGVTTAPGTARLIVDLMLGRKPAIDPRPYDPARVSP